MTLKLIFNGIKQEVPVILDSGERVGKLIVFIISLLETEGGGKALFVKFISHLPTYRTGGETFSFSMKTPYEDEQEFKFFRRNDKQRFVIRHCTNCKNGMPNSLLLHSMAGAVVKFNISRISNNNIKNSSEFIFMVMTDH